MAKETMKEMLKMIDAKVSHLEDICADDRTFIIKLVTQTNQIVKFLKNLELDMDEQYGIEAPTSFSETIKIDSNKINDIKELWDEFESKKEELKEFEDELKKHKDKLTPGMVGES